jgi:hypothetical protein
MLPVERVALVVVVVVRAVPVALVPLYRVVTVVRLTMVVVVVVVQVPSAQLRLAAVLVVLGCPLSLVARLLLALEVAVVARVGLVRLVGPVVAVPVQVQERERPARKTRAVAVVVAVLPAVRAALV